MGTRAVSMVFLMAAVQLYFDGFAFATAFGCKNTLIGDNWREMILKVHNDMRRKLAKGQQAGKNGALPYAKNMKQLYWDCTVEDIAHEQVVKCPNTAPVVAGYGVSFDTILVAPAGTQCQQNQDTKELMTDELRDQALNMHNYYRRRLASGWAKDAKLIYAKPSSAMPALLKYDCTLENTIMTALKTCVGTAAATNKAENFIAYGDYQSERADIFQKVVEQWWSPLADIGNENNLYSDSNPAALKTYINTVFKHAQMYM
ncbi:SCP-like protein [Ancylostoma ceylanicum]|uniref:SCP-like protein n=1 Tax=Ancylostoma ceylanicum TaxID=53326 RepID=A0A0D6LBP4_9BILA|nr:SCP-like protein [Ancylostoma ceylanicum]